MCLDELLFYGIVLDLHEAFADFFYCDVDLASVF